MSGVSQDVTALLTEMADLLDTGLSADAVSAIVELIRAGVKPQALVAAIAKVRSQQQQQAQTSDS